jgi:hypothetical protein
MSQEPLFCFIDDAQFELENFKKNAVPAFEGVDFVYASTFDEVQAHLKERLPLCFLLDIYGSDPDVAELRLPGPEVLAPVLEKPAALNDFYGGLDQGGAASPEAGNTFLRRLYGHVEAWQSAFQQACLSLGQGNAYGLANLAQARALYPWAAALGFSRKALFDDAAAMMLAGQPGGGPGA